MDFTIPEDLSRLQLKIRAFMDEHVIPLEAEYYDDAIPGEIVDRLRGILREQGLWGLNVPEDYGGQGLGNLAMCLVSEEVGKSILGASFGAPNLILNNVQPALFLGTDEQKQKYLWPIIRGEKRSFFGQTEPNAGSDPGSMQTTAVRDGDNWILNGTKFFISWASIADFGIVFAVNDKEKRQHGGITCFIVEKDQPGFKVNRKIATLGGPGRQPTELIFDNCVVPDSQRLGEVGQGFVLAQRVLNRNRMGFGGLCVGKAERALSLGIERVRKMHNDPAGPWARGLLADASTEINAARAMSYYGAWKADQGGQTRSEASMVKVYSSEMLYRVIDRVIQIFGPDALTRSYPLESMLRNARGSRIVEGSSEIQRMLMARFLFAEQ